MEKWHSIKEKNINHYEISDRGNIRSKTGALVKVIQDEKYGSSVYLFGKDKKKYHLSVARLVYKTFGKPAKVGIYHISHIDNNHNNNCFENLKCSRTIHDVPNKEQTEIFNEYAYRYIDDILHKMRIPSIVGRQWQDIRQESALIIWKYLHKYNVDTSFYLFCKRLTRYAFFNEYHKAKIELAHIEYREDL